MDKATILMSVSKTIRNLFKGKDRLVGVDDWDKLIGCIIEIERIALELRDQDSEQTTAEE